MKLQFLGLILLLSPFLAVSQIDFDLGIKAGLNSSKFSANLNDYNSESINRFHWGAFGRIGWDRIYLQPEAYFIKKGGELESGFFSTMTSFDYNAVETPVLLGFKIIKGNNSNLRLMAGPVFSFQTKGDITGDTRFTKEYFEDRYIGYQYGIGFDVAFVTFDVRMDKSFCNVYSSSDLKSKSSSFLITAGIKIF